MKVYIASSWRNQHGVEMLTQHLRDLGCEVVSWIENNYGEGMAASGYTNFEKWVNTENADRAFEFDIRGAMECDLLIYYGPGGKDAAAECGMCYGQRLAGKCIPMVALWAKGEDFGLMRKMFEAWFERYDELLDYVAAYLRKCRVCGCTQFNCRQCIEKTGKPCHWIEEDLCSACVDEK